METNVVGESGRMCGRVGPRRQEGHHGPTDRLERREGGRVPAEVLAAVMHVESRWRVDPVSPAGTIGRTQLLPGTASDLAVHPWDPNENVRAGPDSSCGPYWITSVRPSGPWGPTTSGARRAAVVAVAWPSGTRAYVAAVLPAPVRATPWETLSARCRSRPPWPTPPRPSPGPSVNSATSGTNSMARSRLWSGPWNLEARRPRGVGVGRRWEISPRPSATGARRRGRRRLSG